MWLPDPDKRKRLILVTGGGVAVLLVVWLLTRPSEEPVDPKIKQVEQMERKGDVQQLARATKDPQEAVARRAVMGLGKVGGPEAVTHLQQGLGDSRPAVRSAAAAQIGNLGDRAQAALPAVRQTAARDDSAEVRAAAVQSLGRLRSWDAMTPLVAALEDREPIVRRAAMNAINEMHSIRLHFDPEASADKREADVAALRARLPQMKIAWDLYMKRLQEKDGK